MARPRAVAGLGETARIVACGLYLAIRRALSPVSVSTMINAAPASRADFVAVEANASF